MRVIVVGLGTQGVKRRAVAGDEVVATVDPVAPDADFRDVKDVAPNLYDAALVCVPDEEKLGVLLHLVDLGKHVLVEKPLLADSDDDLLRLAALQERKGVVVYTAYNHRFEPHWVALRDHLASGSLGQVYRIRLFYGNGTARDVRGSWRDRGAGVLPDLASHLLDGLEFWLGPLEQELVIESAHRFENRAFDDVVLRSTGTPSIQAEVSLLSWRNEFRADVYGEKGSAHIHSLCKWGPATFTTRTRVLPSGRPAEAARTLTCPDPTWADEYDHFRGLCERGGSSGLERDLRLNRVLRDLGAQALERFPA